MDWDTLLERQQSKGQKKKKKVYSSESTLFPSIPAKQREERSQGGWSAETGPPSHTHSLSPDWAPTLLQDGFQDWKHTLPQSTTSLLSMLAQTPCSMMRVNTLPRAPSSQDFHCLQSVRHLWCADPCCAEEPSFFSSKLSRPLVSCDLESRAKIKETDTNFI